MASVRSRHGHYIFALWSLLSSFFFFISSPNLSRRILDVYTWCGLSANLGCRSETCCTRLAENTGRKKSRSEHHRTTLSGYILATNAHIDNRKNMLSSNTSSRCPHNMVNIGSIAAEIGPVVWGMPANFNGFRVLAALQHSTPALGVSQSLRC